MIRVAQRFMTVAEAAIYASCGESKIRELLGTSLTRFEVGRSPRIEIAELDAYLLRNNPRARAERESREAS